MSDSQITKRALADSMKALMKERPMKKITISDIVEGCNMNRQSFYYHFKDKYDLVNWIFYTELIVTINDTPEDADEIIELKKILEYFYENKEFYKHAFEVTGQNSFSEYFIEILYPMLKMKLSDVFECKKNVDFYAIFYADAIRVSITRWLTEGAKITPHEYAKLIKDGIEGVALYLSEEN